MDYKEQFIALLTKMKEDQNAGLIPCMIREAVLQVCPDAYRWITSKANN